jgi:hypothetical protein
MEGGQEEKNNREGRTRRQEEEKEEVFGTSKKTARSPKVEKKQAGKWKRY